MNKNTTYLLTGLMLTSVLLSGFTVYKLTDIETRLEAVEAQESVDFSLPTGTPSPYGDELDVAFDDVSEDKPDATAQTLETFIQQEQEIELSAAERERYTTILHEMHGGISCEYCCEAESIITEDGKSACGCSHAKAMRGLAQYLLTEHGDMSNEEIYTEIGKWKTRYFPTQTRSKAQGLHSDDVEPTYINLASNEYRGTSADGGGWVGDC